MHLVMTIIRQHRKKHEFLYKSYFYLNCLNEPNAFIWTICEAAILFQAQEVDQVVVDQEAVDLEEVAAEVAVESPQDVL